MYLKKFLATSALAVSASAQNMNLTALLGSQDSLSALVNLLGQYPDITSTLASAKNVTLFAPNNRAINNLVSSGALNMADSSTIQNILQYHVVPEVVYSSALSDTPIFAPTMLTNTSYTNVTGGQVVEARLDSGNAIITSGLKQESMVVQADLNYTNGVVHIIDQVLTVPYNVSTTALAADLTALAGALTATDLLDTLDVTPDITIFAPANSAFEAIGSAAANLTTQQLASILEYHVINGTVAYSSSFGNGTVKALDGTSLNITVEDGAVFVNAARVINADILVANGVIHVIDSVLNPNGTAEPMPNSDNPVVQYSGASSAPLAALTSGIPAPSSTNSGLAQTTDNVASGYTTRMGGGAVNTAAAGGNMGGGSGSGSGSTSSSGIAALPTGMVGAAALFGAGAMVANW